MPKALHKALERQAAKKHLTGARRDAYVYGTLRKAEKGGLAKHLTRRCQK